MDDIANGSPKKHRRGKNKLNKISFDTETVTKSEAEELLKNLAKSDLDVENTNKKKKTKRIKKNKQAQSTEEKVVSETSIDNSNKEVKTGKLNKRKHKNENVAVEESAEESEESTVGKSKGKRKKSEQVDEDEEECGTENETDKGDKTFGEKKESKRSIKRKKFEELVKNKRQQSVDNLQKSCLEYLSKYKYDRGSWKFVKRKQIWIMENLFEEDKIDDNLWDVVVDYFENSQGGVRRILIDKALKIIEKADSEQNEETEGEEKDEAEEKVPQVKIDRARKVIQSLQE